MIVIRGIKEAIRPFKTALWYGGAEYVSTATVLISKEPFPTKEMRIKKVTLDEMGQMVGHVVQGARAKTTIRVGKVQVLVHTAWPYHTTYTYSDSYIGIFFSLVAGGNLKKEFVSKW